MADLVEADDDIAGGIEAGHAGALVGVDGDAAVLAERGAEHFGELGVGVAAERRIDAVEGVMAVGGIDDDEFARRSPPLASGRRRI